MCPQEETQFEKQTRKKARKYISHNDGETVMFTFEKSSLNFIIKYNSKILGRNNSGCFALPSSISRWNSESLIYLSSLTARRDVRYSEVGLGTKKNIWPWVQRVHLKFKTLSSASCTVNEFQGNPPLSSKYFKKLNGISWKSEREREIKLGSRV